MLFPLTLPGPKPLPCWSHDAPVSVCAHSHRVLRHTVFICTSRSLSVRASACVSNDPQPPAVDHTGVGGMLVFVDVENLSGVR